MEAYTYSNIFDTKGIEYIVIIFFFLLLIPIWMILNQKAGITKQIQQTFNALTASILRVPQGLFYSRNHTWLHLEKSGQAKIGIDDFLFRVLGHIKIIPKIEPGNMVKKGDVIAIIEQDGKQLRLNSPVSGKMIEVNSAVTENGGILPANIYNEGWIFAIQPNNWKNDISGFYFAEDATNWISDELQRVKDFLSVALSKNSGVSPQVVYQEGGELQMNPLSDMESEVWNDFEKEFLSQG